MPFMLANAAEDLRWLIIVATFVFASAFMLTRFGLAPLRNMIFKLETRYYRVLVQQLLMNISPRIAVIASISIVVFIAINFALFLESWEALIIGLLIGLPIPNIVLKHLEQKRLAKLEMQLVDGITTLASAVRAGLTLVQAMELLVKNSLAPIKEEFGQLLREYQMGMDLNQAMRNSSNRIGSGNYRLLFTAIEMHRIRGGDTGESLDRISGSIREIQRLEGKLDAITAQGRIQAWMMAIAPLFIIGIYWLIDSEGATRLITEPKGRFMLLAACGMILVGFLWIRKIMSVDI